MSLHYRKDLEQCGRFSASGQMLVVEMHHLATSGPMWLWKWATCFVCHLQAHKANSPFWFWKSWAICYLHHSYLRNLLPWPWPLHAIAPELIFCLISQGETLFFLLDSPTSMKVAASLSLASLLLIYFYIRCLFSRYYVIVLASGAGQVDETWSLPQKNPP